MSGTRQIVAAGAAASVLSGAPSTAWALLRGADPLAAARAAGTLVPGRRCRPGLLAGAGAHLAVSAVWTVAMAGAARRWRVGPLTGAVAGAGIAALDLGLVAPRRYPAITVLPTGPQLADHVLFGAIVGWGLRPPPDGVRRRARRGPAGP